MTVEVSQEVTLVIKGESDGIGKKSKEEKDGQMDKSLHISTGIFFW